MALYCYKLKFSSPLHLGTEGIGQEKIEPILHSDTLFNAIIINWSLLFDDEIENLATKPVFKLSSAFPYIENELFFPVPIGMLDKMMEKKDEDLKFWKKIEWIPKDLLRLYLKQGYLGNNAFMDLKKYMANNIFYSKSKLSFGIEEERPRVTVDRMNSSSSEYFHTRDFVFKDNSGLFFLVEFSSDNMKNKFESALALLGDNGIGADRSIGKGLFTYEVSDMDTDFETAKKNDRALLISLYFPDEEEVKSGLLVESFYKLKERFGYIGWIGAGGKRRNKIRMLAEGSVLDKMGRSGGSIVKVASMETGLPYNVYRNGIGFLLKINSGEKHG